MKIEVIQASEQDDDINALADPNIDPKEAAIGVFEDDSPYPEVRSAVANTDDVTIPAGTVRAWVLGLFWATVISASFFHDWTRSYRLTGLSNQPQSLNQFFFFRYPSVSIGGVCSTYSPALCAYKQPHPPIDRRAAAHIPYGQGLGVSGAQRQGIWARVESWAVYHQGACAGYDNGYVCLY